MNWKVGIFEADAYKQEKAETDITFQECTKSCHEENKENGCCITISSRYHKV